MLARYGKARGSPTPPRALVKSTISTNVINNRIEIRTECCDTRECARDPNLARTRRATRPRPAAHRSDAIFGNHWWVQVFECQNLPFLEILPGGSRVIGSIFIGSKFQFIGNQCHSFTLQCRDVVRTLRLPFLAVGARFRSAVSRQLLHWGFHLGQPKNYNF